MEIFVKRSTKGVIVWVGYAETRSIVPKVERWFWVPEALGSNPSTPKVFRPLVLEVFSFPYDKGPPEWGLWAKSA